MTVPNEFLPFRPFLVLLRYSKNRTSFDTSAYYSNGVILYKYDDDVDNDDADYDDDDDHDDDDDGDDYYIITKTFDFQVIYSNQWYNYINISQDIVHKYKNTFHNTIKMTPSETQKKEKVKHSIS